MTLFITLINVTLHICFLFTVISKVIYKSNQVYVMSLLVMSHVWSVVSIVIINSHYKDCRSVPILMSLRLMIEHKLLYVNIWLINYVTWA